MTKRAWIWLGLVLAVCGLAVCGELLVAGGIAYAAALWFLPGYSVRVAGRSPALRPAQTMIDRLVAEYLARDPFDPTSTMEFVLAVEPLDAGAAFEVPSSPSPMYGDPTRVYRPGGMRPAVSLDAIEARQRDAIEARQKRERLERQRIYRETHWAPDGRSSAEIELMREIRAQRAILPPLVPGGGLGYNEPKEGSDDVG